MAEGTEPSGPRGRWAAPAAQASLLVAAALAAYWNSFDVPLQFDDLVLISDNPAVHAPELSLEQLSRAASGFPFHRWLPYATFAANHAVHGLRPFGYHLVNWALHAGNALLVALVARQLLAALRFEDVRARRRTATIAGLLFALHPVHTQAVTYVVQRMTSLGTAFALASVALWLAARSAGGARRLALAAAAVGAAYLAVACKENFAILPALVLFLEWVLDPGLAGEIARRWKPWAAAAVLLAGIAAALAWTYAGDYRAARADIDIPASHRLLSQGRILFHYLSLLALPLPGRLHVDYAYAASTGLFAPPSTALGLAGLGGLVALTLSSVRRAPLVSLALGWFLLALAIEQSVLPIDLVFEHRLYFASIGILLLAAASAVRWLRAPTFAAWAVAAPVLVLLGVGTAVRNAQWHDPLALYLDPVSVGPRFARSLFAAGNHLVSEKRYAEGEQVLRRAIELDPANPAPYVDLGNLALDLGRPEDAERWYLTALSRAGPHPQVFYNLGIALRRQKRHAEAERAYQSALRLRPDLTDARVEIAILRDAAGDTAAALAALDEAIRRDPGSPLALENRALILARLGRDPEALADASRAERLTAGEAAALGVLAKVHQAAGRAQAASASAEAALRKDPNNEDAREVVGRK
ncbi:MAG TPA: tetratricopeptide repeat protein [Anaeromyxobacter sp.]